MFALLEDLFGDQIKFTSPNRFNDLPRSKLDSNTTLLELG
jgi:hypothetical protein